MQRRKYLRGGGGGNYTMAEKMTMRIAHQDRQLQQQQHQQHHHPLVSANVVHSCYDPIPVNHLPYDMNQFGVKLHTLMYRFGEVMFYNREILVLTLNRDKTGAQLAKLYRAMRQKPVSMVDFKVIARLGSGSFGQAFMTVYRKTGRMCVIKVCLAARARDPHAVEHIYSALIRERDALLTLGGVWSPRIYSSFTHTNLAACLVQEVITGGTLDGLIYKIHGMNRSPTAWTERVNLMSCAAAKPSAIVDLSTVVTAKVITSVRFVLAELLAAVHYMHKCNILHRDLKTDNVMLTAEGHVRLVDFGLSGPTRRAHDRDEYALFRCAKCIQPVVQRMMDRPLIDPALGGRRGGQSAIAGYPHKDMGALLYTAPEIIESKYRDMLNYRSKKEAEIGGLHSEQADYWSVGIIYFQILTGVNPFAWIPGNETRALINCIINYSKSNKWMRLDFYDRLCAIEPEASFLFDLLICDKKDRLHDKMMANNGKWCAENFPFFQGMDFATLQQQTPPYAPGDFVSHLRQSGQQHSNILESFSTVKNTRMAEMPYWNVLQDSPGGTFL